MSKKAKAPCPTLKARRNYASEPGGVAHPVICGGSTCQTNFGSPASTLELFHIKTSNSIFHKNANNR
jgi:hypothetical protein